ncbi:hypothetical protein HOO68_01805 [Candidatus Gracilibacteria bacterium]|nr:hypothetical protein [Candidatus Gracilibacteria bacterium]
MSDIENRDKSLEIKDPLVEQLEALAKRTKNPDTQQKFAEQAGDTPAAQRARAYKENPHGTPGMISRGPQISDPYERANREGRPPSTSSEQAAINVANNRDPSFRLDQLRGKTNPNSMAAIENCINSVQNQLNKPNLTLQDLMLAANKSASVPADFPIQVPKDCTLKQLKLFAGKTVPFSQIKSLT